MQNLQLKSLRKHAGYRTQCDFAHTLGVNPRTYASWEREEVGLSLSDARRVADALNCSLDELAGRAQAVECGPDSRQQEMIKLYGQLDDARKSFLIEAARGLVAAARS